MVPKSISDKATELAASTESITEENRYRLLALEDLSRSEIQMRLAEAGPQNKLFYERLLGQYTPTGGFFIGEDGRKDILMPY